MAGFRTHITVSTLCGVAVGASARALNLPPETAFLAAGVTAVGGMLPDLDSESGRPVRELSALAASVVPLLLVPRLTQAGLTQDGVLAAAGFLYLAVRYGMRAVIKRASVHRGMFHSIPCMLIFGLLIYLEYHGPLRHRLFLAAGVMVGFLSHLVLDEIYSVDFNGVRLRLNKSAGSALKFFSPSTFGNLTCYGILVGLAAVAYLDWTEGQGQ